MKKSHWTDYIAEMENSKSPQVPAHIWVNLIPHLPKPKKDKRPVFLILSLILITASIAAYYSFHNSSIQNTEIKSTVNTNELKPLAQHSTQGELNLDKSISGTESNNLALVPEIQNSNLNNNASRSNNRGMIRNTNTGNYVKSSTVKKVTESNVETQDQSKISNIATDNLQEVQPVNQNQLLFDLEKLSDSKVSLLPLLTTPQLLTNFGDCYEFNKKRKPRYSVDVYAGPQYSPNIFKAKNNEFTTSADLRELTESANISFLAGIRANVSISKLLLKAGLEYQHIYNQLNHVIGFDTSITVRTLNGQVVGVDTVYGKRTIKNHNYHHVISLPVSIGYQKRLRENALQINAGVSLNFWMQSSGAILDNRLRPVQFNNPLDIYKSSLGLSPFINVQWSGPIMHKVRYFIEPQFQLNPSFDNSSYGIKHSMNSYQLKLGLQYLFQ